MPTLTPKENYLRLGRGMMPEYVPTPMMMGTDGAVVSTGYGEIYRAEGQGGFMWAGEGPPPTEWKDLWGAPWVANFETNWQGLPRGYDFVLDDVTKWDKVVKKPDKDVSNIDWIARSKADLDKIDRRQSAVSIQAPCGSFTEFIAFTGYSYGLIALIEEPESVQEMLTYMTDWYKPLVDKHIEYYNPDLVGIGDDTASKYAPFFSLDVYRNIFKPQYARITEKAKNRDIMLEFHNCGKCELFIPDMIDFGVHYWNPAQTENDLLGIKEKYDNFAVCGGFDFVPPVGTPVTEDMARQAVRDTIDKYAPGGGYSFGGGFISTADDAELAGVVNGWIRDEARNYGLTFYQNNN